MNLSFEGEITMRCLCLRDSVDYSQFSERPAKKSSKEKVVQRQIRSINRAGLLNKRQGMLQLRDATALAE